MSKKERKITSSEAGKMGGAGKHKKKLTKEFYKRISKLGVEARKKKKL